MSLAPVPRVNREAMKQIDCPQRIVDKGIMSPTGRHDDGEGLDDSTLISRAQSGDREAFGDLVRRYQRLVFRVVGGFLRNPADIEDVAQDVFLKAFAALSGFRTGAPFAPWIVQIAVRTTYDRLRQRGRSRSREVGWEDLPATEQLAASQLASHGHTDERTAARDLADRLLACLSPKDRTVLVLADGLGYSAGEVGKALGISALAVRLRLHRARQRARQAAGQLAGGIPDEA
jgi:RNA polymerase sigma-70 factor (ECF subfamily)